MENEAKMRSYPVGLQAFLTKLSAEIVDFGQIIPIWTPLTMSSLFALVGLHWHSRWRVLLACPPKWQAFRYRTTHQSTEKQFTGLFFFVDCPLRVRVPKNLTTQKYHPDGWYLRGGPSVRAWWSNPVNCFIARSPCEIGTERSERRYPPKRSEGRQRKSENTIKRCSHRDELVLECSFRLILHKKNA